MKVYGRHCLVDTDQVALYIERHYDNTYEVLYKTYGNSGYGTIFSGSRQRCQEDNGPHCGSRAERRESDCFA